MVGTQHLRQLAVVAADLDRHRPLPHGRQHLVVVELRPLDFDIKAAQACAGEQDRVVVACPQLCEAGIDVAAQVPDRDVGAQSPHLAGASRASRADDRSRLEPRGTRGARGEEDVSRVLAFRHAGDGQAVGQRRRQVLVTVHRDIDAPREQRLLDLLDEDTLPAHGRKRAILQSVPGGADDLDPRVPPRIQETFRLPQGQAAPPAADHDGPHARVTASPAGRRPRSCRREIPHRSPRLPSTPPRDDRDRRSRGSASPPSPLRSARRGASAPGSGGAGAC